ncbi:MAG TPA: metallophosphoesterase [Thermoplasmata archaeon]|nr:metallophosphoesterase [Thermoplasmata archaeon]
MPERRTPRPPSELLRLSPEEADELLDYLERGVPLRNPVTELSRGSAEEAIVFGDTHGDWRSTEEVVKRYRADGRCLVGLGDYVDRAPDDCGAGSVANALYLLSLAAEAPDRVYLIQGNHEVVRRIPAIPHNLPEEVDELWGPDSTRYERLLGLFERGPLAMTTSNGAYLAHAGFPRGDLPSPWTKAFESLDTERLAEITWAECDASRIRRGAALPWGSRDLDRFLQATGLRLMLRGHDPDLTGRPLYGGRCLTLHTSRIYERYGGVIVAHLPLAAPLRSVTDLKVEHLPTEGRSFPFPS